LTGAAALGLAVAGVAAAATAAAAGPGGGAAATGRVVGTVAVTDGAGHPVDPAGAIVYVVGFTEPPPRTVPTIEQRNRTFVPALIAITAGQSISFPNEDPILHNVFSRSIARPFDLGSYRRGETKTKLFPTTGVVDVYCNIHSEMAATILVLPNRRFARVGADGGFAIAGVPAGTWTAFAFTRQAARPVRARVVVAAGGAATVHFDLVRGVDVPHLNKYGETYKEPGTYR